MCQNSSLYVLTSNDDQVPLRRNRPCFIECSCKELCKIRSKSLRLKLYTNEATFQKGLLTVHDLQGDLAVVNGLTGSDLSLYTCLWLKVNIIDDF